MHDLPRGALLLRKLGPKPPAPSASSAAVRAVMVGNRGRDTSPEKRVRSLLHRAGLRFKKHTQPVRGLRCRADVVFPGERIAVFIDGCFWHDCPLHGRTPASNASYWADKMARNKARDERNTTALTEQGWLVLRYWEHEEPSAVAEDIGSHVVRRRNRR